MSDMTFKYIICINIHAHIPMLFIQAKMYIYIHMSVYIYICTYICFFVYKHMYSHINIHICMWGVSEIVFTYKLIENIWIFALWII